MQTTPIYDELVAERGTPKEMQARIQADFEAAEEAREKAEAEGADTEIPHDEHEEGN